MFYLIKITNTHGGEPVSIAVHVPEVFSLLNLEVCCDVTVGRNSGTL